MIRRALCLAALSALTSPTLHASTERLRAPWDGVKIVPTDAPYNCPEPPTFGRTLDVQGYYTDKKYSITDAEKEAAAKAEAAKDAPVDERAARREKRERERAEREKDQAKSKSDDSDKSQRSKSGDSDMKSKSSDSGRKKRDDSLSKN